MVECTGLENRQGLIALREFKSLLLRHINLAMHCMVFLIAATPLRRGGRVVECTGLENRQGLIALREFKSLLLRHF